MIKINAKTTENVNRTTEVSLKHKILNRCNFSEKKQKKSSTNLFNLKLYV